ncbi:hypothetical protein KJ596_01525 [Patescibacteria group bacterium]|nr:hypothetical protein [Patescibacteria group bacterium]MBU1868084.1 hypothetical protein [Patescibacteria group bacterium]
MAKYESFGLAVAAFDAAVTAFDEKPNYHRAFAVHLAFVDLRATEFGASQVSVFTKATGRYWRTDIQELIPLGIFHVVAQTIEANCAQPVIDKMGTEGRVRRLTVVYEGLSHEQRQDANDRYNQVLTLWEETLSVSLLRQACVDTIRLAHTLDTAVNMRARVQQLLDVDIVLHDAAAALRCRALAAVYNRAQFILGERRTGVIGSGNPKELERLLLLLADIGREIGAEEYAWVLEDDDRLAAFVAVAAAHAAGKGANTLEQLQLRLAELLAVSGIPPNEFASACNALAVGAVRIRAYHELCVLHATNFMDQTRYS